MKILSYVAGHDVVIYAQAEYDPSIRKYRGGTPIATIPYSGRMLSAYALPQTELEPLVYGKALVPQRSAPVWQSADPIPDPGECDFALVSAMYVSACKALGRDTSRLLTIGGTVVDEKGNTVGTMWLNRN